MPKKPVILTVVDMQTTSNLVIAGAGATPSLVTQPRILDLGPAFPSSVCTQPGRSAAEADKNRCTLAWHAVFTSFPYRKQAIYDRMLFDRRQRIVTTV
jgi:hypothetical protein